MHHTDKWFCETCEDDVDMDDIDYRYNHVVCNDKVIIIEGANKYPMEEL